MSLRHTPAMMAQVLELLNPQIGHVCVDCTVGGAGHAKQLCKAISQSGIFVGMDQDPDAIQHAKAVLAPLKPITFLINDHFGRLSDILPQLNIDQVDLILADIGVSQYQLQESGRGFSFQKAEPLDMRMNPQNKITAHEVINHWSLAKLTDIFHRLGEERWAKRIAQRIVGRREQSAIETSLELAQIITTAIPARFRQNQRIHPATRVFMALRMAVNQELDRLKRLLAAVPDILAPGGRFCVLSFHSLEDRMVKRTFQDWSKGCVCPPDLPVCGCERVPLFSLLTPKVVRPDAAEIEANPMARSTRLRAVEKRRETI